MATKPVVPTVGEVASAMEAGGNKFFSSGAMKFFNDKKSNYGVRMEGNMVILYRKKVASIARPYGALKTTPANKSWVVDMKTGSTQTYCG